MKQKNNTSYVPSNQRGDRETYDHHINNNSSARGSHTNRKTTKGKSKPKVQGKTTDGGRQKTMKSHRQKESNQGGSLIEAKNPFSLKNIVPPISSSKVKNSNTVNMTSPKLTHLPVDMNGRLNKLSSVLEDRLENEKSPREFHDRMEYEQSGRINDWKKDSQQMEEINLIHQPSDLILRISKNQTDNMDEDPAQMQQSIDIFYQSTDDLNTVMVPQKRQDMSIVNQFYHRAPPNTIHKPLLLEDAADVMMPQKSAHPFILEEQLVNSQESNSLMGSPLRIHKKNMFGEIVSPLTSVNTSMKSPVVQVTENETNYAQKYIKNNYGYDILEIDEIEKDMQYQMSQQFSSPKRNESQTSFKKSQQIEQPSQFGGGQSIIMSENNFSSTHNTPEHAQKPPLKQDQQTKDARLDLSIEKDRQKKQEQPASQNSPRTSNYEKSEIQYDEIKVTDSFSIMGNLEQTRNSLWSSAQNTHGNIDQQKPMVELQSLDSDQVKFQRNNHKLKQLNSIDRQSNLSFQSTKQVEKQNLAQTMQANKEEDTTMGTLAQRPNELKLEIDDSKVESQLINYFSNQSPLAMTNNPVLYNKYYPQSSSSMIASSTDQQAKTKLKTNTNTPVDLSQNTSPKNRVPTYKKMQNKISETHMEHSDEQQDIIYELSQNNSKSSLQNEVQTNSEQNNNQHRERQQQRSFTGYNPQPQPRLLDQQLYNSNDQSNLRYDTQEDDQSVKQLNSKKQNDGNVFCQTPLNPKTNNKYIGQLFQPSHSYRMQELQGLGQSENDSSVVLFNAIGQRNDNSNGRSRGMTGEDMNEHPNLSNRYSCLAEKIEQLKMLKGNEQESQRLSLPNQTNNQDNHCNNQTFTPNSRNAGQGHSVGSKYANSKQFTNTNSLQMSPPSHDMSTINMDEKMPCVTSPKSMNTNSYNNSKNRSQIVTKSFTKKSPTMNKGVRTKNTGRGTSKAANSKNNTQYIKLNTNRGPPAPMSMANRTIQLPTSSSITMKRPDSNTKKNRCGNSTIEQKLSPIRVQSSHKRTGKSGTSDVPPNNRGKSLGTSKAVIDITVMQKDKEDSIDRQPDSPSPTYNTGNLNDVNITQQPYNSKIASLIQLPKKSSDTARLSEKNSLPRSLSSVQNRHANSRLKAILQKNCFDSDMHRNVSDSKAHRRNKNQLAPVNNSQQQTHQQVLIEDLKDIHLNQCNAIRTIDNPSPTPPQSSLFANSVSNTPLRNQYGMNNGLKHDVLNKMMSQTCKISDLVGQKNLESRERHLQRIISDSQQREQRQPGHQVTMLIRQIDNKIQEEDIMHLSNQRKKNEGRTLSPTSHSSPQVTESKSFRTSLISMFRGGVPANTHDDRPNHHSTVQSHPQQLQLAHHFQLNCRAQQCKQQEQGSSQGQMRWNGKQVGGYTQSGSLSKRGGDVVKKVDMGRGKSQSKQVRTQAKSQEMPSKTAAANKDKMASQTMPKKSSADNSNIFLKGFNNFRKNFLDFSSPSKSQEKAKITHQKSPPKKTFHKEDKKRLTLEYDKGEFQQTMPIGQYQISPNFIFNQSPVTSQREFEQD